MGEIYTAAVLTIVAAISDSPRHGLPHISGDGPRFVEEPIWQWWVSVLQPTLDLGRDLNQIIHSPWATRAWTFQEAIFSCRRLIMTERQAIFICNEGTHFESVWALSEETTIGDCDNVPGRLQQAILIVRC